MFRFAYDINKFNFSDKLSSVFQVDNLNHITNDISVLDRSHDQLTKHHEQFYKWMKQPEFFSLYEAFIQEYVRPLYNNKIVVQRYPTFRICYPNNVAIGEYHKDKNYRDANWALQVKELNFFLPFTNAFDSNTIWVESQEDKKDFTAMHCKYGECIRWDASNLTHGNMINQTGQSRVSVDFRVIEYHNYIPSEIGSINQNIKFKLGDYYKLYD